MEIKAYVVDQQGNEQITDHFKVKEFACKDKTPIVFVDDYLAVILEIARKKINKPIVITSGYRTTGHNQNVGGAKYSYIITITGHQLFQNYRHQNQQQKF